MNKPITTIIAAIAAVATANAEVTTEGKNVTVSGTGNELTLADAEVQVTIPEGAAASAAKVPGSTIMMTGGSVTLGPVASTESWKEKAVIWADASVEDTTWFQSAKMIWRDCRHPKSGWAIANTRGALGACPQFETLGTVRHLDFLSFSEWRTRAYIFELDENGELITNGASGEPFPSTGFSGIKHIITVFGSDRGGGRGIWATAKRGGDLTNPTYTDPIFGTYRDTWVDGEQVDPTKTGFNGGWQVISVKTIAADQGDTKNWEIGDHTGPNGLGGGQRFAEILIFTNDLTKAERVSAERYLANKYSLTYHEDEIDARLFGTGTAEVTGGEQEIGGSFKGTINIAAGAKVNFTDTKVAPTAPAVVELEAGTMAWHDSSRADSVRYGEPDAALPCNRCLYIKDLANPTTGKEFQGSVRSAAMFAQNLALGPTLNWLDYKTDEPIIIGTVTNENANGVMMRWDGDATGNCKDTRMGFFVLDTRAGGGTLFLDENVYGGPRLGIRYNVGDPIFKTKAGYEQLTTNSPAYLNGIQVDAGKHSFNNRGEVLSFDFCETVPIKNVNYYSQASFVVRHGEFLLYKNSLTETQRKDTEAYLMNKWLGITPAGYGDLSGATVAGAGDVTIANAAHPGFAADYSGAIDATAATTLDFVYAEGAVVNPLRTTGTLALADSVTVGVDFKAIPAGMTGTIVLAQADTITGGTTLTLDPAAVALFKSASIAITDNKLVLSYERVKALVWKVDNLTAAQQALFDHAVLVIDEGIGVRAISTEVGLGESTSTALNDYTADTYRFHIMLCNSSGQSIGVSPTYTYADLEPYVNGTLGMLAPSYTSGEYVLPRQDWTDAGLSFVQQLTNAMNQAASDATIKILPGEYSLAGVYMYETSFKSGNDDIVAKTHLYISKKLRFVGDTDHWSGAVVLTGDARFYLRKDGYSDGTVFEGLTFKNFQASEDYTKAPASGNLDGAAIAGAIYGNGNITATNCVFEGCLARAGGAVVGIVSQDCRFYKNKVSYNGSAAYAGSFVGCEFEENNGDGGALWWPGQVYKCRFLRNTARFSTAIIMEAGATIDGCYFEGNTATVTGGAIGMRKRGKVRNCVFVGNQAGEAGGAIECSDTYGDSSTNGGNGSIIEDCYFTNNCVQSSNYNTWYYGGAIASRQIAGAHYLTPNIIRNCDFTGNYSTWNGGAVYGGAAISNCTFNGNYLNADINGAAGSSHPQYGGAVCGYWAPSNALSVVDCTFVSNTIVKSYQYMESVGAAIYNAGSGAMIRDSYFEGNHLTNHTYGLGIIGSSRSGDDRPRIEGCTFRANFANRLGIVCNSIVSNCTFEVNETPRNRAAVSDCDVFDSVFTGNRRWDDYCKDADVGRTDYAICANETGGADAYYSTLTRCTMDGGLYNNCKIDSCIIQNCTNTGTFCVFRGGNYVTNTLIKGYGKAGISIRSMIYRWDAKATAPWINEFVNCTFADNVYGKRGYGNSMVYCGTPESSTNHGFENSFFNCLFHNNQDRNGVLRDLSATCGSGLEAGYGAQALFASNCVMGVAAKVTDDKVDDAIADLGGNMVVAPAAQRLVKSEAQAKSLDVALYTPKASSPVKGKGDASFFAEGAKDLAGNDRVSGGKVDIGCYQSYLNPIPMMLLVK